MDSKKLYLVLTFILVICMLGVLALACGGSRDSATEPKLTAEENQANQSLDTAYNLMSQTKVLPPFMKDTNSLNNFDSGNQNKLLPSPSDLLNNKSADGTASYTSYEKAISNINEAVNLIGAARKNHATGIGQKAYLNFVIGYLYTISAASRLVNSPLGEEVINFDSTKGTYSFEITDTNGDGKKNFADISGNNKTFDNAKLSARSILDAIFLLTGREYKITTNNTNLGNISGGTLGIVINVDSTLLYHCKWARGGHSPNTKANSHPDITDSTHEYTTHTGPHNSVHHLTRAFEFGGEAFEGIKTWVEKVKGYIKIFDDGLQKQTEDIGLTLVPVE